MSPSWLLACLVLSAAALVQSILMGVQAWEHARFTRSRFRRAKRRRSKGRTLVLAPCKGVDPGLEDNLRAILNQDHRNFEVTFIVESADDPACPIIQQVMAEFPEVDSRVVVAGRATDCGQKIHNLRAATAGLSPRILYLAFVDSDARPRPSWLRLLVDRLNRPTVGATTGYRWFVPKRPSLANHLLCNMNLGILTSLGPRGFYPVWGGSWALKRKTFQRLGLRDAWNGTLSDDLVAGRLLHRARLAVGFEPVCVVASPIDLTLRDLFSFLRRQYVIVRHYSIGLWFIAIAAGAIRPLGWLATAAALGGTVGHGWLMGIPAAMILLLYGCDAYRICVMYDLARFHCPDELEAIGRCRRLGLWAGPAIAVLHWLATLTSVFGHGITWRGIRYRLRPGGAVTSVEASVQSASCDALPSVHAPHFLTRSIPSRLSNP